MVAKTKPFLFIPSEAVFKLSLPGPESATQKAARLAKEKAHQEKVRAAYMESYRKLASHQEFMAQYGQFMIPIGAELLKRRNKLGLTFYRAQSKTIYVTAGSATIAVIGAPWAAASHSCWWKFYMPVTHPDVGQQTGSCATQKLAMAHIEILWQRWLTTLGLKTTKRT